MGNWRSIQFVYFLHSFKSSISFTAINPAVLWAEVREEVRRVMPIERLYKVGDTIKVYLIVSTALDIVML